MPEPLLHMRLLDEHGQVYVDEDIGLHNFDLGAIHAEAANMIAERGLRWRLEVTDPDGDIAPIAIEGP